MEVTFKYVGQGDCVIIEWDQEGGKHVGIVDCNQFNGRNAAVDFLEAGSFKEVDFIILSHPHRDHYSGILPLLRYCEQKEIKIGLFGHTAGDVAAYLRAVVMSYAERDQLANMFRKVRDLHEQGLVGRRGTVSDLTEPLELEPGVTLRFVAPSEGDRDEFLKSSYSDDLSRKAQPNPNLLSTIIIIEAPSWHIVLTSDAEYIVLRRAVKALKKHFKPMVLGQVPHHGSPENHYREFWRKRMHAPDTPVVVSVGPNRYGHPSREVIDDLRSLRYRVDITDQNIEAEDRERAAVVRVLNLISSQVALPLRPSPDLQYSFAA